MKFGGGALSKRPYFGEINFNNFDQKLENASRDTNLCQVGLAA